MLSWLAYLFHSDVVLVLRVHQVNHLLLHDASSTFPLLTVGIFIFINDQYWNLKFTKSTYRAKCLEFTESTCSVPFFIVSYFHDTRKSERMARSISVGFHQITCFDLKNNRSLWIVPKIWNFTAPFNACWTFTAKISRIFYDVVLKRFKSGQYFIPLRSIQAVPDFTHRIKRVIIA